MSFVFLLWCSPQVDLVSSHESRYDMIDVACSFVLFSLSLESTFSSVLSLVESFFVVHFVTCVRVCACVFVVFLQYSFIRSFLTLFVLVVWSHQFALYCTILYCSILPSFHSFQWTFSISIRFRFLIMVGIVGHICYHDNCTQFLSVFVPV